MSDGDANKYLKGDDKPFVPFLQKIIFYSVKLLAILMVLLILASIIDVTYIFYEKILKSDPKGVLGYEGILSVLGAVLIVLICIEIFNNIILYFKDDRSHVKLVLATALIAVSRKVIILDYTAIDATYIYATGAIILATAIAYWLVSYKTFS